MSRPEWLARSGVAVVLTGSAAALQATGGSPWMVAGGAALGLFGLGVQAHRALTDASLQILAPAITRGVHPGRVALLIRGVPTPGQVPFGATCFVATAEEAIRINTLGLEPGWLAPFPLPAAAPFTSRWLDTTVIHPSSAHRSFTRVGPTRVARNAVEAGSLAETVYGTDLVRIPALLPTQLDALLGAWAARGIRATSLTDALAPE